MMIGVGRDMAISWSVIVRCEFYSEFTISADIKTMSSESIVKIDEERVVVRQG